MWADSDVKRRTFGIAGLAAIALMAAVWDPLGCRDRDILPEPAADAGSPQSDSPARLPGQPLIIELMAAPSPEYAPELTLDDADETYAEVLAELDVSAQFDPVLSRAAREVAVLSAVIGDTPSQSVFAFVMRSAGALETTAALYRLSTTSDDLSELRAALQGALEDAERASGPIRVGVGEVQTPGDKYSRRIVVLVTRRDYTVDPTPRAFDPGSRWTVRGNLPRGFQGARATILDPSGAIRASDVITSGNRFEVDIDVGTVTGVLAVSIDGVDETGPTKLLQLTVHVGEPIPRRMETVATAVEGPFASVEQAEQLAFGLLAADRAALGASPLVFDPELSAVARAHSEEMRDRGVFGHLSAATGLAGDRLAAAGYRSVSHAENLAKNTSIAEAQRSLVDSVSHRANIARAEFERVGIGLARDDGEGAWYLTQVFAIPVKVVDPEAARAEILERIATARSSGASPPVEDHLVEIAERGAERAAENDTDGLPEELAASVTGLRGQIAVSVQVVFGLNHFQLPPPALEPDVRSIGVGVHQSPSDLNGRTGIVVMVLR